MLEEGKREDSEMLEHSVSRNLSALSVRCGMWEGWTVLEGIMIV